MISVCIPIYNCDVRKLVLDLHAQAESIQLRYEILLIDDNSDIQYRQKNRELGDLSNIKYKELSENIGRSSIRNLLAQEAQYKYLIFMDCDAGMYSDQYLLRYSHCCEPNVVCCGGRVNLANPTDHQYLLRWKFSKKREEIDALTREQNPNDNFLTFNFLIDKEIFNTVKFDEGVKGYGHEDTLFGIALKQNNIPIIHIDNPLLHIHLDDCNTFIEKTENAVRNLVLIQKKIENPDSFTNSVKILRTEKKLSSVGLCPIILALYKVSRRLLLKNLKGKKPNLTIFDFYKLGYLCSIRNTK